MVLTLGTSYPQASHIVSHALLTCTSLVQFSMLYGAIHMMLNEMHVIVCFTVSCPDETTDLLWGRYNWSSIMADEVENKSCTYMGEGDRECEIVSADVARVCNEIGKWEEPDVGNCLTRITRTLCDIRNVSEKEACIYK